jgi:lipopolysaccharide transport system permease protein
MFFDAERPEKAKIAMADICQTAANIRLPWALARLDLRNRYRGSVIGPFWLTLSTAVMVAGMGFLYASLFKMDWRAYLPHLVVSLIIWNTFAAMINEATGCFIGAAGVIRQMPLPYTVHAMRVVMRSLTTAAHSWPLIGLVFLACGFVPYWTGLLAFIGVLFIAINAFFCTLFLGMLCARFRDIPPIVSSVMQIGFFVTPIIWKAELLGEDAEWLLLNPFYVVLETVRGPLLVGGASLKVWVAASLYTMLLAAIASAFFVRFRGRISFWV